MAGIDRKQILRIDCIHCKGKGWSGPEGKESPCLGPNDENDAGVKGHPGCGGSGVLEREVGFKFDTAGKWEKEEIAETFGIGVDQVNDAGHSTGD